MLDQASMCGWRKDVPEMGPRPQLASPDEPSALLPWKLFDGLYTTMQSQLPALTKQHHLSSGAAF